MRENIINIIFNNSNKVDIGGESEDIIPTEVPTLNTNIEGVKEYTVGNNNFYVSSTINGLYKKDYMWDEGEPSKVKVKYRLFASSINGGHLDYRLLKEEDDIIIPNSHNFNLSWRDFLVFENGLDYINTPKYKLKVVATIYYNNSEIPSFEISKDDLIIKFNLRTGLDLRVYLKNQNEEEKYYGYDNRVRPKTDDYTIIYTTNDSVKYELDSIQNIEYEFLYDEKDTSYFESLPNNGRDYNFRDNLIPLEGLTTILDESKVPYTFKTSLEKSINFNIYNKLEKVNYYLFKAKVYYKYDYLKGSLGDYETFESNVLEVLTRVEIIET